MTYYVSITGFQLKSLWYLPKFLAYTMSAKAQAHAAPGNISAELHGPFHGVYHTMTVWEDRRSMTRFMAKGAHAKAMKVSKEMYTPDNTKVYGYECDTIPTWEEAYELWKERGTMHGTPVRRVLEPKKTRSVSSTAMVVAGLGAMALVVRYLRNYHPEIFEEQLIRAN